MEWANVFVRFENTHELCNNLTSPASNFFQPPSPPFRPAQILTYNGSAIIAMTGKDCVAIASDLRFGVQFQTLATDYQKVYQINDQLFIGLSGLGTDAQTLVNKFKFRHNLYSLREERDMSPKAFAHMVRRLVSLTILFYVICISPSTPRAFPCAGSTNVYHPRSYLIHLCFNTISLSFSKILFFFKNFQTQVSSLLYEKRFGPFFCEPIIAGLNPDSTPFICGTCYFAVNSYLDLKLFVRKESENSPLGAFVSSHSFLKGVSDTSSILSS